MRLNLPGASHPFLRRPAFSIQSVTSAEEAELAVLGTVPPKRRYSTSLIDVGSNKTNGGYFMDASQSFDAVYFPGWHQEFCIDGKK